MKARCDRRLLLDTVGLVAGVTASRATRPILQSILVEAKGNQLQLSATDLELSIRTVQEALSVEEEGAIALPADKLLPILREARGESVDLSTDGLVGLLRTSGSQFRLTGEHADDFPEIPEAGDATFVPLSTEVFKDLSQRTEFAAARELGRYAINGVLVELDGQTMRLVSTDGRRMAMAEATLETEVKTAFKEILPLKGIHHFAKAIGKEDEEIGLAVSGRRTLLRVGNTTLVATAVEAEFPDYKAAIPAPEEPRVTLEKEPFFDCVRQAAVMAGDEARAVTLEFSEGSLVVSSRVEGRGDARAEMSVNYAGEQTQISFNPDYLMDFAKVSLPDQLPFCFRDESGAAVFRPTDGFVYVLMPIST